MAKIYDTPSKVAAEGGEVHVDGPGGVSVSLTPEAPADTSDRLALGAAKAAGQRIQECHLTEETSLGLNHDQLLICVGANAPWVSLGLISRR